MVLRSSLLPHWILFSHPNFFSLLFFTIFLFSLTYTPTAICSASKFNADISKWNTAKVTTMQSSTSTSPSFFCCPLCGSFSLEFCLFTLPVAFFFLVFSIFFFFGLFQQIRHRHPPTAFQYATVFNADISKWNTTAVTTMHLSTSTPPSFSCCPFCFFHLSSLHSSPLLFLLPFFPFLPQYFTAVASNEHCVAVHGCL